MVVAVAPQADVDRQVAATRERNDRVVAFETDVRQQATGQFRADLDDLYRQATAAYVREAGSVHAPLPNPVAVAVLAALLVAGLAGLNLVAAVLLVAAIGEGLDLGADLARDIVGRRHRPRLRPDPALLHAARAVDTLAHADLAAARRLAAHGRLARYGDVTAALAVARQAANRVDTTAALVTVAAVNDGTAAVAKAAGAARIWVAERDACLVCLAYAGHIVEPGSFYPAGLTFGDPTTVEAIDRPPRHPRCRCHSEPWIGDDTPGALPAALRREAQRSVLRGWAAGSEAAKLRAAARLVAAGPDLPASVVAGAAASVRRGRF